MTLHTLMSVHTLTGSECTVHAEIHIPTAGIISGRIVRRPARQPEVRANREALEDHVENHGRYRER